VQLKQGGKALVGNKGYRKYLSAPASGTFEIDEAIPVRVCQARKEKSGFLQGYCVRIVVCVVACFAIRCWFRE
jgi:hypothetical protein